MKKYFWFIAATAVMVLGCNTISLEEKEEEKIENHSRTTIPYSLNSVATATKVSYGEGTYALASGDKLRVTGSDRTDIEGELAFDSDANEWRGTLSYETEEGAPDGTTGLVATLIHAANTDYSSYANAIVSSTVSNQLQYAVENYSWFTADYTYGDEDIYLSQQASFLDVNVTFTFGGGTAQMAAGTTYVDVDTPAGNVEGPTKLVADGDNFKVQFMAVVPAGQDVKDFTITVCDRLVTFTKSSTLEASKKYTVNRSIEFKPQLGDPFWSDGTYGRFEHPSGVDIVGIIVYVNRNSSDPDELALDNAITESTNGGGNALVMALYNANQTPGEGEQWGLKNKYSEFLTTPQSTRSSNNISGYSNTAAQYAECNAASLAKNYENGTNYDGKTTGWFLPTIGQWMYSICAYGEADPVEEWTDGNEKNWLDEGTFNSLIRVKMQSTNTDNLLVKKLNDRLENLRENYGITYDSFGMTSAHGTADNYWTSSEKSNSDAFRMNLGSVEQNKAKTHYYSTIKIEPKPKNSTYAWFSEFIFKVRPFLAF